MNIKRLFIIFSIILGLVPVTISTSIIIVNFNAKSIEMIKQNVTTAAHDQSMNLEIFFKQNISDFNIVANMPITKELLNDYNNKTNSEDTKYAGKILNQFLSSKKNEQSFLIRASLIDKNGVIIASSDNEYIDKKIVLSNEDIEKLTQNKVVVTDIIKKEDFNNGIKSAIIATPIFAQNKYYGAMIGIVNMSYFEKIVNDIYFFETGKIAIMDSAGNIASSSSNNLVDNISKITSRNNLYEKWNKMNFDNNPNGIIEYNINGVDKIGYYSKIDNTGWVVLSGVEWNEFKAPIDKRIRTIIMLLIFILVLVGVSYGFIINHFSKPIDKLLEYIRKIKQGNYKDRFIYDKDNEFGEIATALNDLIDNIEKNKRYIEEKNRNLQSLTSNIPGGVHRSRIENGEYILDFVSGGYLNLLGYKKYEFKKIFDKKLVDLIYENDRKKVVSEITEQLRSSNKYAVEYRVKRKDESVIWLLDNGQVIKNRDGRLFSYNVAINITESKTAQENLRLSEERYCIVMSQTEDIIFEWNIEADIVYFSGNWKNKFNYKSTIVDISKKIYNTNIIYKDDIKKFGKILNDIVYGDTYQETEIRFRKSNDEYIWCKIRITAMFDENGNVFKAIGAIIDIDKEKTKAEELLFKAQRDSLTGLYNKGIAQNMIEEYMNAEGLNLKGALFVIDVDNFKAVNDNLGHLAGDSVLIGISSMLSEVFNENSIVGRIGGDEFIVFLKNIDSDEFIYKKANDLVIGFRKNFIEESLDYKVSGSIGIAKYPEHGKLFKKLFINADKALYVAKNKGKDTYWVFEDI